MAGLLGLDINKALEQFSTPQGMLGLGLLSRPNERIGQALGGAMSDVYLQQQAQALYERQQQALQQQKAQQQWMAQNMPGMANAPAMVQQEAAKAMYAKPDMPTGMRQNPDGSWSYDPAYLRGQEQLRRAGATTVAPTLKLGPQENEESKTVGTYYGKAFTDMLEAERMARQSNANLTRLGQLFENTYTGTGGESVLAAKRALSLLGADVQGVSDAEAGNALANQMALELRNPAGGAGMPGAMSDKDREFLVNMLPSLSSTAEGRRKMIETRRRINSRTIEVAAMARQYRRMHGALDEGFFDSLAQFSNENPLFDDLIPDEKPQDDQQPRVRRWGQNGNN